MNKLVFISPKGNPITTSVKVAEYFNKEHKNVIQSIKTIIQSAQNSAHFYYSATYVDSRNRKQEMFVMNRDGFFLLVMGFTGKKAMKFKLDFINAFNKMENQLKAIALEKAEYADKVLNSSELITTSVIADDLGTSAVALNQKLKERGIIYKLNGSWMITQKYREMGLARTKTHPFTKDGRTYTSHSLYWTERGRKYINKIFKHQFQNVLTT